MRNYIALAFAVFAFAAPLQGQRGQPVYHGDGFDIVLPSECKPAGTQTESSAKDGYHMRMSLFGNDKRAVVVARFGIEEISDTTLATRRAMLQLMRVGMLQASGEMTMTGEMREFERGDRVGWRVPVSVQPDGEREFTAYGTAEMSVARQGRLEMWMVFYLDHRQDAAAGERVLDSFRLTDAEPGQAEARGFRILEETPRGSKAEKTER